MAKSRKPAKKTTGVCGLVMPISAIDGCPESHWAEVRRLLSESVEDAQFEVNLVSDADDVGVIQKRIIQDLYDNPIVVCDVSGRNPNVMFELGLRLAFDKPTVIVKDDKTDYSFDTSPIEHIPYRRDLRYADTLDFKERLTAKIVSTSESASEPGYSPFLKAFGTFKVAKLSEEEVSADKFLIEELSEVKALLNSLMSRPRAFDRNVKASRHALTTHERNMLRSFVDSVAVTGENLSADEIAQRVRVRHPIFKYVTKSALMAEIDSILTK